MKGLLLAALLGLPLLGMAAAQTLPSQTLPGQTAPNLPVNLTPVTSSVPDAQNAGADVYLDGLPVLSNLSPNTGGTLTLAQPGAHTVTLVRHGQLPGAGTLAQATYTSTQANQAVGFTIGTGYIINFQ